MIVVAAVALTRMFEPISAWILSCLTSLFTFSSFVFIVITSKYVIVVSDLLKLLFVCNLFKLFFLVPVWISADVAMLLTFLFKWVASLLERLLLLLLSIIVKVLWRLMVIILRHRTHHNLLLSHSWMCLIIRIMLVMLILLRLSMLLRSVIRNSLWDLLLWRWLLWLVLGLVLLLARRLLVLELRGHFVVSWNGWSHADNCWNLSFIFRWSLRRLRLALVIIIISISINALWRLGKIVIMAMRILIISASSFLSGAKLRITLIKLLCHRLINGLSNCIVLWFSVVVLAHKIMIIHIFLNASWRSAWIFDVALVDVLDLLNVSLYHIEVSRFKLFCFL